MDKVLFKTEVYSKGIPTTTGRFLVDRSKPIDKDGNALVNIDIVNGIAQREVNKAKGV